MVALVANQAITAENNNLGVVFKKLFNRLQVELEQVNQVIVSNIAYGYLKKFRWRAFCPKIVQKVIILSNDDPILHEGYLPDLLICKVLRLGVVGGMSGIIAFSAEESSQNRRQLCVNNKA